MSALPYRRSYFITCRPYDIRHTVRPIRPPGRVAPSRRGPAPFTSERRERPGRDPCALAAYWPYEDLARGDEGDLSYRYETVPATADHPAGKDHERSRVTTQHEGGACP